MEIKRVFTKLIDESPDIYPTVFSLFDWKYVDIEIKNHKTGETIFECKEAHFPSHYSQQACDIIASKYFYRGAIEKSLADVANRMAWFWTDALIDEGLIKEGREARIFSDEIIYALLDQMWAPNSPQWFNTGIKLQHRIKGDPDDLFYWDAEKEKAVKSEDRYTRTQASACFILDVKDKLLGPGSISDHFVTETKLFKGGSGTGSNFSSIRADGERLSSGGTSSGLMSFLDGLDKNAGAIKSGGTTRRAAKMVIVDIDHPEIEDFIEWKVKEERKARVLGEAGYGMEIGGEAYSTVSGQNSNNSIRIPNYFMEQVTHDYLTHKHKLTGRVDESVDKEINAKELWKKIVDAAWECGDPGIQFSDTINAWNTCKASGSINASNPCAEFVFLDNTACNLASINLVKFLDENNKFMRVEFVHLVSLIQLVLEASIHWGQFPTPEIAENSYKFRPTGLGFTNFATFLLRKKIPYNSELARLWGATIASLITEESYRTSAEMAEIVGPFEKWEENKEPMKEVLRLHKDFFEDLRVNAKDEPDELFQLMSLLSFSWISLYHECTDTGFRNAQVTCIAPTGTISLAMDCDSTGIEPIFCHTTYKKLADGSVLEMENPLISVYREQGVDEDVLLTAQELHPFDHVDMVAAIQPHISGAISKTVNLPNEATKENVAETFARAYNKGCKSITIYRDGSKGTQPLQTKREDESVDEVKEVTLGKLDKSNTINWSPDNIVNALEYKGKTYIPLDDIEKFDGRPVKRNKPEGIRRSVTHPAKIESVELYITIGFYDDGKMSEIFVSTDKEGTAIKGLLASLSKSISSMLQFGIPAKSISEMLRAQKYEPAGIVSRHPYIKMVSSISDLIAKVIEIELGDYSRCEIKPEVKPKEEKPKFDLSEMLEDLPEEDYKTQPERIYDEICSNCGSTNLISTGVCKTCQDCGTTTGCG